MILLVVLLLVCLQSVYQFGSYAVAMGPGGNMGPVMHTICMYSSYAHFVTVILTFNRLLMHDMLSKFISPCHSGITPCYKCSSAQWLLQFSVQEHKLQTL